MPDFDDNKLFASLKRDSLEAYEMLFKKYYKLLCLQASRILRDGAGAEDVVQELFIEIWDKKKYRQIDTSLKAYLYSAVRNRCLNKIRKERLISRNQEAYQEYRQKTKEPVWMEQKELSLNLNRALQKLPAQRLRAFTLVYVENKKYQEAADEMGVSVNSVKTHLRLALRILREQLGAFR